MLRGYAAIFVCTAYLIVVGLPMLLISLVHAPSHLGTLGSRVWARIMLRVCGVQVTVENIDAVGDGRPRFFLGNHQSALDIPIIIHVLGGKVRFMGKKSLFHIPLFGWLLVRYGYISVDRSNARATLNSVERGLKRLQRDSVSLAVFPEGTRSCDGTLLPFRMGTMKIAAGAGLPIVPFAIDGAWRVNPRNRLRCYPGRVRLAFGRPLAAKDVTALTPEQLHDRIRAEIARLLGTVDSGTEARALQRRPSQQFQQLR